MPNVVVLPAPFGPSSPTISPEATSTSTSRTTVRPPYDLVRPSVRSVAIYFTSRMEMAQSMVRVSRSGPVALR